MAMGIPVLTCPNHLYAGSISAALIEHAGFSEWIAGDSSQLSEKGLDLARRYKSSQARRALAELVRNSPVCDTVAMPKMFAQQLGEMLRIASLKSCGSSLGEEALIL